MDCRPPIHITWNVFCHHRARPIDRIIANRHSWIHRHVGPEPYAVANRNRLAKFWTRIARFGISWMSLASQAIRADRTCSCPQS